MNMSVVYFAELNETIEGQALILSFAYNPN